MGGEYSVMFLLFPSSLSDLLSENIQYMFTCFTNGICRMYFLIIHIFLNKGKTVEVRKVLFH